MWKRKPVVAEVGGRRVALICTSCGYVHEFVGDSVELYEA